MTDTAGHDYLSSRSNAYETCTEGVYRWLDDAKCLGVALDADHNPYWEAKTSAEAQLLCAGCTVKSACLLDAHLNGGAGVRGGMLEGEW